MDTTENFEQTNVELDSASVALGVGFAIIGGVIGSLVNVGFEKARVKLAERKAQKALEQ